MNETHPFKSFIPPKIKYLILGSFPALSKNKKTDYDWYYGSAKNQFWRIIEKVYNTKLTNKNSKQELFKRLNIGIADIIKKCKRKDRSSLDVNLTNIRYNLGIRKILTENNIKTVFFTSKFVEKLFKKQFGERVNESSKISLITLPSPSPRYTQLTIKEKIEKYKQVLPHLNEN